MKKVIIIEILALVLVTAIAVYLFAYMDAGTFLRDLVGLEEWSLWQTEPATEPPTDPPTEPPTDPPTEPPTEPSTEPPFEVEIEEDWSKVLAGHELTAKVHFVYDLDADKYLVRSAAPNATVYPASITKLFSAYVALQILPADYEVKIGREVLLIDSDSSVAKLMIGDVMTVEQLVAGMMLPSGNDATYALATAAGRVLADDPELVAEDAIALFVERMNQEAETQGLIKSHFVTPDGIHNEEHYLCIRDLVTISMLAVQDPVISKYAGMQELVESRGDGRYLEWENSNLMLDESSRYYSRYANGLKTGFTTAAGYCLLSTFHVGGRNILIGVFGCPYANDRFADTVMLFARVFDLDIPVEEPPPATDPAPTEPAATEPAVTEPAEPEPAPTEPVDYPAAA